MGNRTKLLSLTALFVTLSILSATQALAQSSNEQVARSAFQLGNAHYENGEFIEAAEQFEKAYKYSGRAQLLYNLYLAYRDANLPEKAANALRRYLKEADDVPNRDQIEAKLRALERGLAKQKEKPPPVVQKPVEPQEKAVEPVKVEPAEEEPVAVGPAPEESKPEETTSDEPSEESYLPLISYIMMGAGGGMVLASIITGIVTSSAQSELEDECPNKDCTRAEDIKGLKLTRSTGETMAIWTDILLFGGIAIAGAGVALLFLGSAEESETAPISTTIGCSTTGCSGSMRVSF
jgi:tetratricopeptide (TPR) repeat protein